MLVSLFLREGKETRARIGIGDEFNAGKTVLEGILLDTVARGAIAMM